MKSSHSTVNSTNVLSSHWFYFVWLAYSGNKFFRVGPNISEKCVLGGTIFRGVKIKCDSSTCLYVLSSNMAAISVTSQTFSEQRRSLSVSSM